MCQCFKDEIRIWETRLLNKSKKDFARLQATVVYIPSGNNSNNIPNVSGTGHLKRINASVLSLLVFGEVL